MGAQMYTTDPYLTLGAYHQRSRRLREEAAADAIARRAARDLAGRRIAGRPARRRRVPAMP